MELLVMRHAKSSWSDPSLDDFDRPLKDRGKHEAAFMGQWLLDQDLAPDLVLSSTAKRAKQTLKRANKILKLPEIQIHWSERLYLAETDTWLAMLVECPEAAQRVMIVGHNPGLDDLVEALCAIPPRRREDGKLITTATVAHLSFEGSWSDLRPGACRCHGIFRPRELAQQRS